MLSAFVQKLDCPMGFCTLIFALVFARQKCMILVNSFDFFMRAKSRLSALVVRLLLTDNIQEKRKTNNSLLHCFLHFHGRTPFVDT